MKDLQCSQMSVRSLSRLLRPVFGCWFSDTWIVTDFISLITQEWVRNYNTPENLEDMVIQAWFASGKLIFARAFRWMWLKIFWSLIEIWEMSNHSSHEVTSVHHERLTNWKTVGKMSPFGRPYSYWGVLSGPILFWMGIRWGWENVGRRLLLLSFLRYFLQDHPRKYGGSRILEREKEGESDIFDSSKSPGPDLSSKHVSVFQVFMHLHERNSTMVQGISLLISLTLDMSP